jgi:hypothetical protein
MREGLPTASDSHLGIVDKYALLWTPRPSLQFALESYEGATLLPSASGLALAGTLVDAGWRQTALSVTYGLAALQDMHVKFAVGNGEGENGENLDPQQYFGFQVGASVVRGVRVDLGVSLDGNSAGSAQTAWEQKRYEAECGIKPAADPAKYGHSTQRLAASLLLDGTLPGAEGLKAALGWQRSVLSDLDKKRASAPTLAELAGCRRVEPDELFVESDEGDANTVQHSVYAASVSYRFLRDYFVGLDYSTRRIDTGSVKPFRVCTAYEGGACVASAEEASNHLQQTAYTAGVGMDLTEGLGLTLEYHRATFAKKYAQEFYEDRHDSTSPSLELFNARLAYDWK